MFKSNLTKKKITNKIYKNLGFSKNISSDIVDSFIELLISEIIKSNKIKISKFGTFSVIKKKERIGRNPKTKIVAKISSRKIVKFKPSLLIKERLNND
jgi:integration host factor subunit alpha